MSPAVPFTSSRVDDGWRPPEPANAALAAGSPGTFLETALPPAPTPARASTVSLRAADPRLPDCRQERKECLP